MVRGHFKIFQSYFLRITVFKIYQSLLQVTSGKVNTSIKQITTYCLAMSILAGRLQKLLLNCRQYDSS